MNPRQTLSALTTGLLLAGCPPTFDAQRAPQGTWGAGVTNPASSALAFNPDETLMVALLPDHHAAVLVDVEHDVALTTIEVCEEPGHALFLDADRVAVTCRREGTVVIVDLAASGDAPVARIPVGTEPIGLQALNEGELLVALAGESAVVRVAIDAGEVRERYELPWPEPRAVVVTGDTVWVAHRARGELSRIELATSEVEARELSSLSDNTDMQVSGVFTATASPSGDRVVLPHNIATTSHLGPDSWGGAIRGGLSQIDAATGEQIDTPDTSTFKQMHLSVPAGGWLTNPTALAVAEEPTGYFLVSQGTETLKYLHQNHPDERMRETQLARIGPGANALLVSRDLQTVYVLSPFTSTLIKIGLDGEPVSPQPIRLAAAPPNTPVQRGRLLFHTGTDRRLSASGSMTCTSCHPDGRTDGLTWSTTQGPRNTPPLFGGIMQTAPFHWPGDLGGLEALQAVTVQEVMGGDGLDLQGLEDLAAFIDQVPVPPLPPAEDLQAVARGQALFESDAVGCLACHAGDHGTDGVNHDIGTGGGSEDELTSVQTPVLHGLIHTGPYLHDGSAADLTMLLEAWVATDRMGTGSHLTGDQLDDLAAYLRQR